MAIKPDHLRSQQQREGEGSHIVDKSNCAACQNGRGHERYSEFIKFVKLLFNAKGPRPAESINLPVLPAQRDPPMSPPICL